MMDLSQLKPVECPHCGSDDIEYREEAYLYRTVYGKDKDGQLVIDGNWKTSDGDNPVFSCNSCLETFPLPEKVEIDWT